MRRMIKKSPALNISIHAPVKGATHGHLVADFGRFVISIHAPVKGATTIADGVAGWLKAFQSTHP